jgi:methionyl-tRNA formyltransferase
MRTAFLGTPEIAVPALRVLAARTTVTLVVTQPDRPAGRGNRLTAPAVKIAAEGLGLPIWQPDGLRGTDAAARLATCDLAVVFAYGELLREDVLAAPRRGCINLHASLLPRWRGASPLQAAIRARDQRTGMTVMQMERGLDTGPVHLALAMDLPDDARLPWLHDRMADLGAQALAAFLDQAPAPPTPQEDARATLCRKLTANDGRLDWTARMADLDAWVRAYTPAPGCWTALSADRLRILSLAPRPGHVLPPGTCIHVDGVWLVGCGDGAVALDRIQAQGGTAMPATDWLRGHALPARLG